MTMNGQPVYVGTDTYIHSDPADGLYVDHEECAECGERIGMYEEDTADTTVQTFIPYWSVDHDGNTNVCEPCYERGHQWL